MTSYTYQCIRSGKWWAISVPGVRGVHTQTRRLDQAEAMVREALALVLDVDPLSFTLERVIDGEVAAIANRVQRSRDSAQQVQRAANKVTVAAVDELQGYGLSLRDIGTILALSHQRVGQLANNRHIGIGVDALPTTERELSSSPDVGLDAATYLTSAGIATLTEAAPSKMVLQISAFSEQVALTIQPLLAQWSAAMQPLRDQMRDAMEPLLGEISAAWIAAATVTALGAERPGQAMFEFVHELRPELADKIRGTDADPSEDDARLPAFFGVVREMATAA